ncbi:MAG: hypothetical protein H0A75_08410, partial [Candidatus Methanofishera endochildressiae]|nr:hypothetical protein [Candidatus Methanofishera endochildressiae]
MQAEFEQDPWAICTLRLGSQPKYYVDKQLREQTAMDVFAGDSEMFDAELISLSDNIDLRRADQHITA